jgi:glutaredoxin
MMYMIYGVTDCPHCLRAQALCMEKDVDYAWVMMDWSSTYRDHIKEKFSWTTYPIITKLDYESGDEDLLGGHSELLWFLSDDE